MQAWVLSPSNTNAGAQHSSDIVTPRNATNHTEPSLGFKKKSLGVSTVMDVMMRISSRPTAMPMTEDTVIGQGTVKKCDNHQSKGQWDPNPRPSAALPVAARDPSVADSLRLNTIASSARAAS